MPESSRAQPPTVLVISDNPLTRIGLQRLLSADDRFRWGGAADAPGEARKAIARSRPALVALDLRLPRPDWLATVTECARSARVLVLAHAGDAGAVDSALRAGATSYLVHGEFSAEDLVNAAIATASGRAWLSRLAARQRCEDCVPYRLTPRETEVMMNVAKGLDNSDIARQLFLCEKTVKNHINNIFIKLRVRNRAEAIVRWLGVADPLSACSCEQASDTRATA